MKFKNKVVSAIVSTAMVPIVLQIGVFQSSQVCHAVEIISVKDVIAEMANPKTEFERRERLHRALYKYCLSKGIHDVRYFLILEFRKYIQNKGPHTEHAKLLCNSSMQTYKISYTKENGHNVLEKTADVSWDEIPDDVLKTKMYKEPIMPIDFDPYKCYKLDEIDIQIVD